MDEGKCTFQLFANRQYDCQKERKKKEFEGTSSQMVIFSKSDRTGVEESEAREWVPKSVSSSEDDGTDDWKPTQDESEGYSEEEEEQERKRIPKMVAASEEDGTHDSRPTQDESKDDSKDEAEHLGQMIHKVAMEKGAFVSSELPQRTEERQQVAVASKSQRHHCVRNGHKCPICGHVYADIVQHLRVTEQVVNKTELTLLSQFSHRHFSTNLDCPVRLCQSKHLKRLDKHLEKVHKLQTPMIKLYMQKAKDRCIAKELALLRVSNPTPQMVSHVGEVDDAVIEEGIFRALEEGSKVASAIASSSKAHSDHATLIHWPAPPSDSEAPSDHATLNHRPAPPSDSEAPSDHATLNHWPAPPSDSEAPSDHDTLNHRPAPPSDSEAHSDHSTLIHRPARDDSVDSDSEAHSDHAILNHRPAPPSDSKALGDSTRPNLQPPLSASDTLSDHTIPIMQPPSISSSKVTCHSTGVSPDVLIPSSAPYYAAKQRRGRPLPRTPAPGCKNCQILFTELQVVKQLLECELESNHELKQIHSSTKRANVKYSRRKRFSLSKAPHYVRLVEEFRVHAEGVNPSRKIRDNAKQRATHVIHFLEFMADPAIPNVDLLFLRNHGKVRELWSFLAHLQAKGFKPTTQRAYLMDAIAFMKYILNMSPPQVRLGKKRFNALLVELRARYRDVGREVVVHQLNVWRSKSNRLVQAEKHALLIEEAPQKIAAALAEDPAEDTLQSRALTTNAIATYAANKRKRREDRGSVQDEDSEGSEKEEQQSSGTEELLDRTLFQCSSNKMVSPGQGEGAGSAGATIRETKQDLKKGVEHLQKVTYQLRKRKMVIFYKNDRTDVGKLTQEDNPEEEEEDEAREWVPKQSVSSSDDDGTDDWKPTQDESEGYSEEEEEQERKRIPKLAKKNKTGCPMPQREMAAASEEDGTHDSRPTQDESKDDSKDEAEHLGQMIHKVATEKMQQAYVSQDKAMTVNKSSEKRVIHQTRCLKRLTFHQSTLFEDTIPRSDNNKKDQSGMSSAAIITSEQLEEKEIQEESLEKMKSEGKEGKRKENVQQEPLEKMSGKKKRKEEKIQAEPLEKMSGKRQRKEEKIQAEPLEKMKSEAKVGKRKEKVQQEPLEKMKSEAKVEKRKEKVQQEPLEKMKSEAKVGKRKEKVQQEPLEKMRSKRQRKEEKIQAEPQEKMKSEAKVGKRKEKVQQEPLEKMRSKRQRKEEKIQAEPLEKMKSEAKVEKRKEKVQQEPLEKMKSEAKVEKRKEKVQQEPLEKMRSKRQRKEEKIQAEPLEKMKSEAKVEKRKEKVQQEPLEKMKSEAKVEKRKEKVQQEPLEKMRSKRQRKEEKIQAEPLEKMKSEAKVEKRKEKVQQEPLEKMKSEAKVEKRKEKVQQEPLEKMRSKRQRKEEKIQADPQEKMSGKRKRKEEKIQAEPLGKRIKIMK
ncbi:uncharacterized protein LOC113013696 isoform X19 [Astatotilapia calliptera]|uniref:uncharacterized protein LOC113013696 isoform X19 n=1 Tax=Astatotilapia calliptera TaxID=8154 RepID=UPI000E4284FF|nr:uncharacterized protein LOC113013696 isoform X19 [Astatotilapia calliptera]